MTDTVYLEGIIRRSGLKKGYIANQLGITRHALVKKISNETEFKASEIEKMSEILRVKNLEERHRIFLLNK